MFLDLAGVILASFLVSHPQDQAERSVADGTEDLISLLQLLFSALIQHDNNIREVQLLHLTEKGFKYHLGTAIGQINLHSIFDLYFIV